MAPDAQARVGLIGLAVMGENLALNIARNGFPIAAFNRDTSKVDRFLARAKEHVKGKNTIGTYRIEEFVASLERPRKIILLVKAGSPVDAVIDQLKPLVERGDIIIDGGNSHFEDTRRREKELKTNGIRFIGSGRIGWRIRSAMGTLTHAGRRARSLRRDTRDLGKDSGEG